MNSSIFQSLSSNEFEILCSRATKCSFIKDEIIFKERDEAQKLYFVKSGSVLIYIDKYHRTEDISTIHNGECFGEMAILNKTRRTASAKAIQKTTLQCLDKADFQAIIVEYPDIGKKIHSLIKTREKELALKESILDSSGFNNDHVNLSIKGDPSLRETVFDRERYKSIVDNILPELSVNLESMLLERNVFRIVINFNSGEVEAYTIFNPFTAETHAANKLTSISYLDRHFPMISYTEKADIINNIFSSLAQEPALKQLSTHWQQLFLDPLKNWTPVTTDKIKHALSQLSTLRSLENYYLRNFSINTIQDVIRMQFNCDGTHIVDNREYLQFLDDNI